MGVGDFNFQLHLEAVLEALCTTHLHVHSHIQGQGGGEVFYVHGKKILVNKPNTFFTQDGFIDPE